MFSKMRERVGRKERIMDEFMENLYLFSESVSIILHVVAGIGIFTRVYGKSVGMWSGAELWLAVLVSFIVAVILCALRMWSREGT